LNLDELKIAECAFIRSEGSSLIRCGRGLGVRDLQVELKPPDVTPSNFQTRH
jgi:hypothetical protein